MVTPTISNAGGVATQSSDFTEESENFDTMRDTLKGQKRIKDEGTKYLLKPPALAVPGNDPQGTKYAFYKSFAEFPELVSQALFGIQGLVHHRPPVVELPSQIEYLLTQATPDGKTLDELWMDATREVFLMGRFGLLPEVYENSVYLCQYHAESIINWHKVKTESGMSASLVVLHEPVEEPTADGFSVECVNYYRVLKVDSEQGGYVEELYREGVKQASTGEQPEGVDIEMLPDYPVKPSRMGKNWDFIPFVPINAINNEYDLGQIPLLPVAQKSLDMYRKSATYHRTLYLKGDPPLLRVGFTPDEADSANTIGGGVTWDAANPEADAKYIEPTGEVISDQRQAIIDDLEQAKAAIGKLMDNRAGVESGEALRERRAANSVTLVGVLQSVAEGFEKALRNITVVMGGNPDDVKFEPNLDFMAAELTAEDVVKFTTAKNQGAPISLESMHDTFRRGGVTKLDFEDEMSKIEDEDATFMLGGEDPEQLEGGGDPQDPNATTDPEELPETPDEDDDEQ